MPHRLHEVARRVQIDVASGPFLQNMLSSQNSFVRSNQPTFPGEADLAFLLIIGVGRVPNDIRVVRSRVHPQRAELRDAQGRGVDRDWRQTAML